MLAFIVIHATLDLQVLWEFYAIYCHLEGLHMTSDIARKILLFIFYGHYSYASKDSKKRVTRKVKPVLHWIHGKTSNGRSRFVTKLQDNFRNFITLYNRPENDWAKFLTDKGEGNPPMEYLVEFELGLRNYGTQPHAMCTKPLRTPEYWSEVPRWRKREAYIALARFLTKQTADYKQWDCFRFTDYTSRQRMARTFNARHFPLSDGNDEKNFCGQMNFDWAKHSYAPRKKRSSGTTVKKKNVTVTVDVESMEKTRPMVYDVENDCLVPL